MTFKIYKDKKNAATLMRELGYHPIGVTPEGEVNCVKPIGAAYPRFHVYLKDEGDVFRFSLHLDQKKTSYEGSAAHSGDYESETVREEAQRIKDLVFRDRD